MKVTESGVYPLGTAWPAGPGSTAAVDADADAETVLEAVAVTVEDGTTVAGA